ncbi:hypothetical protein ACKLNO_11700 [Neisseriaceae bacterium B1]
MNDLDWKDFFSVGGDGFYVLISVVITLVLILGESVHMRKLWKKQQETRKCEHIKKG